MHCEFPIRLKTLCKYSLQPLLNPRPSHFLNFTIYVLKELFSCWTLLPHVLIYNMRQHVAKQPPMLHAVYRLESVGADVSPLPS